MGPTTAQSRPAFPVVKSIRIRNRISMAPSKYITLVSAEGYEYVLPREACHASQMLRTSVDPDKHFKENRETVVNLPEMRLVVFPVLSS